MIYNLVKYLSDDLPALSFVANGWEPNSERDSIMVRQSGGTAKQYNRNDYMVQIISRAKNVVIAKTQIETVFAKLKYKYGLELTAVTIGVVVHDAVKTYQIAPIELPGYVGADKTNLEMWSFNSVITTE